MKNSNKKFLATTAAVVLASVSAGAVVSAQEPVELTKVEEKGMEVYKVNIDKAQVPAGSEIELTTEGKFVITSNGSETVVETGLEHGAFHFLRDVGTGASKALPVMHTSSPEGIVLTTSDYDNLIIRSAWFTITDMGSRDPGHFEITMLMNRGIVNGYNATLDQYGGGISVEVKSQNNITRAQFATILGRALEVSSDGTNIYSDVTDKDEYAGFTNALTELGIIMGSQGKFNPQNNVTKEQAAIMIARTLRHLGEDTTPKKSTLSFKDASNVGAHAVEDIAYLAEKGIVRADSSGNFNPRAKATRADVCTMLYRALNVAKIEDFEYLK